MADEKTCIICFEASSKDTDYVTCPYCNFESCKDCLKRFILEGIGEAYCMNVSCKKYFTRRFLGEVFGLNWIARATKGSYKSFIKAKQLETQKAKIPEIMNYMKEEEDLKKQKDEKEIAQQRIRTLEILIEPYNKLEEDIFNTIIRLLKSRKNYTWGKYARYNPNSGNMEASFNVFREMIIQLLKNSDSSSVLSEEEEILEDDMDEVKIRKKLMNDVKDILLHPTPALTRKVKDYFKHKDEMVAMSEELESLEVIVNTYNIARYSGRFGEKMDKTPSYTYVQGCPSKDCRGLIEKETFKCSLCDIRICKKCRVEKTSKSEGKEEEGKPSSSHVKHVCKKEDLESVKLIRSDSKPCPKCATAIFKISGCFGIDTPILLYDNSIKMSQDIEIGDVLIGDDGNKRMVLNVCSGVDELYKITQSNGMEYVVNSKHTLALMDQKNDIVEMIVDDYLNLPMSKKQKLYGYKCLSHTKSTITIQHMGKGKYFGWLVDGNHRFVGPDLTVLKNCNQIFCTNCHIAFDWNTGRIDNGAIHNPHYFEFLQRNGISQHDNHVCGDDVPTYSQLARRLETPILKGQKNTVKFHELLIEYHPIILSRAIFMIDELRIQANWSERKNQDSNISLMKVGVRYLKKEIEECDWERKIYEINEKVSKNNFMIEIYNSLRMILTEAFRKFYVDLGDTIKTFTSLKELTKYVEHRMNLLRTFMGYLEEIRNYFNESIVEEYKKTSLKKGSFTVLGPYWDLMLYSEIQKGLLRPKSFGVEEKLDKLAYVYAYEERPFSIRRRPNMPYIPGEPYYVQPRTNLAEVATSDDSE
jgi:hypothetical protein